MFVHNYNVLTDDEKLEFKSLATYVKQLEKCLPPKNKSLPKKKPVVATISVETSTDAPVEPVQTLAVEDKVVEPVKAKRGSKKSEPKEVSPTEIAVAAIVESASTVVVEKEETKRVVKKATNTKLK
jgi:hypothetical protein